MSKPIAYILCEVSKRSFLSYLKYAFLLSQVGFDVCIINSYLFHLIVSNQPDLLLPGIIVDKDFSHRAWNMRHRYLKEPWLVSGFVEEAILFSNSFVFEFLSDQRSLNRANYIFASSPQEQNVVISALRSFNLNSDAVKLFADPRYTISYDLKSDYAINSSPYIDIFGEYSLILGSYSIHENPNNVESREKHFSDVIEWYRGSSRDRKYIEQVLEFHQCYRQAHWRMFEVFNDQILGLLDANKNHKFIFRPHPGFTMRNGTSEFGNLLKGRFNFDILTNGSYEPIAASASNIYSTVSTSHYLLCQAGFNNSYVGGNVTSESFILENTWNNYSSERLMNSNLSLINSKSNSMDHEKSSQQSLNLLKEIYNDCVQWSPVQLASNLGFLYSIDELPASHKFEAFTISQRMFADLFRIFSHNADQDNCAKLLSINKDILYIKK
jgi:hypothetical protein